METCFLNLKNIPEKELEYHNEKEYPLIIKMV